MRGTLPKMLLAIALLGLVVAAVALIGVDAPLPSATASAPRVAGGDPEQGRRAIPKYGCGACHRIPGVRNADGTVGPSLARTGEQAYIAGNLPNEPDNLIAWIEDPQAIEPGTAMPDMDVSAGDAADIAAYLYTLP